MSYYHYEMDADAPDTRTPAEKQRQYEEFQAAWANATDLFRRGAKEGWTEERGWGERLPDVRKGRVWTSIDELAEYLAGEWRFWARNEPTPEDRKVIARTAREMWVSRVSERVVPS